MATVQLEHVTKVFPNGSEAVSDLSLDVDDGQFMVLVGPSGCGKTTTLRMVAGLEDISDGLIRVGERVINDLSPRDRDMAMVFQNYALYPHMTVAQNIGFALRLRKMPKQEVNRRVGEAARILGLSEHLRRKPSQLSGGQRQRVAMGRAIVREPAVFLMDEPLSNLDAKLRVQMRSEILRIQRRLGVATLYVTHDQTEAMTMGDRVAVLSDGRLQQCDAPQVLYDTPANLFVAAFIGSPAMNLYRATLAPDGASLRLGEQTLRLPAHLRSEPRLAPLRGEQLIVGIRPEHLADAALEPSANGGRGPGSGGSTGWPGGGVDGDVGVGEPGDMGGGEPGDVGGGEPGRVGLGGEPGGGEPGGGEGDGRHLAGAVELVEALGSEKLVHFRLDAEPVRAIEVVAEEGQGAGLDAGEIASSATVNGVARVDPTSRLRPGGQARLRVAVEHLHLFDPASGEALTGTTDAQSRVLA